MDDVQYWAVQYMKKKNIKRLKAFAKANGRTMAGAIELLLDIAEKKL